MKRAIRFSVHDAVQSMWAVNGAMLSPQAAENEEAATASPETISQKN
jgi:hypothetical protein